MIVTQEISGAADLAASRYKMLTEAWRAAYSRALDQSHFGTPKQINEVAQQAYTVASVYLEAERQIIADTSHAIALEAQGVTLDELNAAIADELSDAVSEHVNALSAYLERELTIQIERDIAFLAQSLRKTVLSVGMSSRAQALPLRTALLQYRIANAGELTFYFHDRRNHKWPSAKFARSVWRHHLLSVYNETALLTLTDHGVETAFVSHTDKKAPFHNMEISVNAGSSLPTYAEIRDDIFHPNSEAILTRTIA